MDDCRGRIEEGYNRYLEKYPEQNLIKVSDYDYPFQGLVIEGDGGAIRKVSTPLSRSCVIEERQDLPGVQGLPVETLEWLPVGLMQVLKIQRLADHEELWKFTGDVVRNLDDQSTPIPPSLQDNIVMVFQAVLSSDWSMVPPSGDWSWGDCDHRVIQNSSVLARYTAFPTVEGVVKSLIARDITMDGDVRSGRYVRAYGNHDDYTEGETVSHIGHLLWHLETDVANDLLKSRLEDFQDAVRSFFEPVLDSWSGAYGFLAEERNTVLHGQRRAQAEVGILLNLLSLLVLNIGHIPQERRRPPD